MRFGERRIRRLDHFGDRELEDFAALHVDELQFLVERGAIERMRAIRSPCTYEHFRAAAVGARVPTPETSLLRSVSRITAPAPSPKRIAVDAIVFVENLRKRFGADEHDARVDARAYQRRRDGQAVDESAAGDLDVEGRLVFAPELGRHQTGGRGKIVVRA